MPLGLSILVVALVVVAIAVQVYYVRGLEKAGVEVNRATKAIVYTNIGLLTIVALGLLAYGIIGEFAKTGM